MAKVEFQPKETLDAVDNDLKERKKKRDELTDPEGDDSEEYDHLDDEIKVLRGKSKILNKSKGSSLSNNTTSIKVDFSLDIWGFGVTLYPLFTDKKNIFKANLADDTLDGKDEELRVVNWNGPSTKDLNKFLPKCHDVSLKDTAKVFFQKVRPQRR